ncbi:hypothetical protein [Bifidobacterium platyrrhinorum]|uniref:hypothetical protein n=1 Tax=Bifidobacterium platyrrhinorum TaxID=2661628 RepID=UPI0017854D83|nr:hypothetical protein [Bifidobacterium platyrrhinorum]
MTRTRRTARQAGALMEAKTAEYLNWALSTDTIERRRSNGVKDRGDLSGIRYQGHRVVVECKNTSKMNVSKHLAEAETERGNDDALIGVVIQKRPGIGITTREGQSRQLVMMTLGTFALILNDGLPLGPDQPKKETE